MHLHTLNECICYVFTSINYLNMIFLVWDCWCSLLRPSLKTQNWQSQYCILLCGSPSFLIFTFFLGKAYTMNASLKKHKPSKDKKKHSNIIYICIKYILFFVYVYLMMMISSNLVFELLLFWPFHSVKKLSMFIKMDKHLQGMKSHVL